MKGKYAIGLDFGSLAGRAVLVNIYTGEETAESVYVYPDAVIDRVLPGSEIRLPKDYALQNPADYMDGVTVLLRDIAEKSGVAAEDIIGIGVDATASTVLPLDSRLQPLCFDADCRENPHSWIKLWKHHSPQPQADRMNRIAKEREEPFLNRCGGKVSAEWFYPKVLETLEEAPDIFHKAEYFVELGDWIVYLLTGDLRRSSAIAGLHAHWSAGPDAPSDRFLAALAPELVPFMKKLNSLPVQSPFSCAGGLTKRLAEQTGLRAGTPVSIAATDSPVALLSLAVADENACALILGTSSVLMHLSKDRTVIPGAMACVKDHMMPGYYGNMFGQSSVGDSYRWFVENMLPYRFYQEAQQADVSVYALLNRYLSNIRPSEDDVIALDWLNGSRSLLQDASLTGSFIGLRLSTTPDQLYHALVESTAFELKTIFDAINESGVRFREVRVCGGIAEKSPEIVQLFSDVLDLPIQTPSSTQTVAHGAAILGAVAAGKSNGGYDSVSEAAAAMHCRMTAEYKPRPDRVLLYGRRYRRYLENYAHFSTAR